MYQNVIFDQESATIAGELVSEAGRKQQFMIYPAVYGKDKVHWTIEWIETNLYLRKRGYEDLKLSEYKVYEALVQKGINIEALNSLIQ